MSTKFYLRSGAFFSLLGLLFVLNADVQAQYTDSSTSTTYEDAAVQADGGTIEWKVPYYDGSGNPAAPTPNIEHRITSLEFNRVLGVLRGMSNDGVELSLDARGIDIDGTGKFAGNLSVGTSASNLYGSATGNRVATIQSTTNGRRGILELAGEGSTVGDLIFLNTSASSVVGRARLRAVRGSAAGDTKLIFSTSDTGADTDRAAFDEKGNFGIGTVNPYHRLTVMDGDVYIGRSAVNQANSGTIRFTEFQTGSYQGAYIRYDGSANRLNIGVHDANNASPSNDTAALSINRGNAFVGVGMNRSYNLDVQGGSGVAARLLSTSDAQLRLECSDSWAGIRFQDSSNNEHIWFNGTGNTFAIGGGGSAHNGMLHIDGGTTIGANIDAENPPLNGLLVEGQVCDMAGNCLGESSGGRFLGFTSVKIGGGHGSYDDVANTCDAIDWSSVTGGNDVSARACSSEEMVAAASNGTDFTSALNFSAADLGSDPYYWVLGGAPGFTAAMNDCQGFTTSSAGVLGRVWFFSGSNSSAPNYGAAISCNTNHRVACCTK